MKLEFGLRILRRVKNGVKGGVKLVLNNPVANLATIVSVTLTLCLVSLAMLVNIQMNSMGTYWSEKVEVSVFLCTDHSPSHICVRGATQETVEEVGTILLGLDVVEEVFFETREEAWARFIERYGETELANSVSPQAIPESFRVKLYDPLDASFVQRALHATEGVEMIQDQRLLLGDFFRVLESVGRTLLGFAVLQAFAAGLLVSHTFASAVMQRRKSVEIMKLVGARTWYIRAPFTAFGVLVGVASGLLSFLGLLGIRHVVVNALWSEAVVSSPVEIVGFAEILQVSAQTTLGAVLLCVFVLRIAFYKALRA